MTPDNYTDLGQIMSFLTHSIGRSVGQGVTRVSKLSGLITIVNKASTLVLLHSGDMFILPAVKN